MLGVRGHRVRRSSYCRAGEPAIVHWPLPRLVQRRRQWTQRGRRRYSSQQPSSSSSRSSTTSLRPSSSTSCSPSPRAELIAAAPDDGCTTTVVVMCGGGGCGAQATRPDHTAPHRFPRRRLGAIDVVVVTILLSWLLVTTAITESTLSMSRRPQRCTLHALAFTRGRARTECTARTYIHTHDARHTHGRTHKCIMIVNNREKTLATENAHLFQTGFDLIQFKHFVDLI